MEIKGLKRMEQLDRIETMLTELTLHDTMDSKTFERYVFPLIEEVRLLREAHIIERKLGRGDQT